MHSRARYCANVRVRRVPTLPPHQAREVACACAPRVLPASQISGMQDFLDSLKYDHAGLVTAIVQNVDTGELCMQGFADAAAINETLQTGLATFFSRSRQARWCKGESSGNFIEVSGVYLDCDRDSLIYMGVPRGPSCHTGARTCWFESVCVVDGQLTSRTGATASPMTTLASLQHTIDSRKGQEDAGEKPSWTAKLLNNPELLCSKVREEAGELCETWEQQEGRARTVSEAADLLYHSLVLLSHEGVPVEDVLMELRSRFGVSGIEERASRRT